MEETEQQPLLRGGTRQGNAFNTSRSTDPAALEDGGKGDTEVERLSRREWVGEKLEAKRFHQFVIALITIDAACVLADLVYTFLFSECTPNDSPPDLDSPAWLEVLGHISLAITTFFLLEIPLALFAFGFRYYTPLGPVPHASLHLFDAVVIITTFVLEVVLRGKEQELVGLLVLLRLWRLVKLVGGIAVGAGEIDEQMAKDLADVKQELQEKNELLATLQAENTSLKARIQASDT